MSEEARTKFDKTMRQLNAITEMPEPETPQSAPTKPYSELTPAERRARLERARPKDWGTAEQRTAQSLEATRGLAEYGTGRKGGAP